MQAEGHAASNSMIVPKQDFACMQAMQYESFEAGGTTVGIEIVREW